MTMNPGSAWLPYTKKLGAHCLLVDHRFYGDSRPTADISTDHLWFLSSQQALADLAHFRTVITKQQGLTNRKWVAFGGSYPGALAARSQLKYSHLIYAAVASSEPIHTTVNFSGDNNTHTVIILSLCDLYILSNLTCTQACPSPHRSFSP
uniref:Serine aminopeptidase S33 domain-containing protein n=1 Tax=Hucho hucho TaxID=62062 RepID=A0A4W5QB44_9TELE